MAARVWVISDTHFGHKNILAFECAPGVKMRPGFKDVDEMDEVMIARWNDTVRAGDHVYHLGDVAMRGDVLDRIGPRLNGVKRLVRGNHDQENTSRYIRAGFREIHGCRTLAGLVMTHIPIHPGSLGRFLANVHGHVHNNGGPSGRYINVSVEVIDYTPVLLDQLVEQAKVLAREALQVCASS